MLEPQDRRLLLESLRPPEGHEVDFAIATTFTLDLLSLLTAPLGFTFFELEGDGTDPIANIDPLVLLRSLRRYADRIAVFCQSGRIAVPRTQQLLFASLEDSVVQVSPSSNGIFHPKVWVLRFVAEGGVRYRLICLSRNLTFDRSWDTVLVMDGGLTDRKVAYAANHPLGDFIAALPDLAIDRAGLPERIREYVAVASDELRRVDFDVPEPFQEYAFWPLGIRGYAGWPFANHPARMLIVSPFLGSDVVQSLGAQGKGNVLISRLDALQTLSREDLSGYQQIYALNPSAGSELQPDLDVDPDQSAMSAGLHAKLFVAESGRGASVWTGSANATEAALGSNVEFMVELVGGRAACGIDMILGTEQGTTSFRDLLIPFEPLETPLLPDPTAEELAKRLEDARCTLSSERWLAVASKADEDRFDLTLRPAGDRWPRLDESVRVQCWPITVAESMARPLATPEPLRFGPLSVEGLTPFFAFELTARAGGQENSVRFVVNARLTGAPADRRERLLRYHLRDPQQLIRFLLLLLSLDEKASEGVPPNWSTIGIGNFGSTSTAEALLEPMLRALAESPAALDQVAQTLDDLKRTPDGAAVIPEGLAHLWAPIWEARQRLSELTEV